MENQFICRVNERELGEFRMLCTLMHVSRGDPMYALYIAREYGPESWRALRDAEMQGTA